MKGSLIMEDFDSFDYIEHPIKPTMGRYNIPQRLDDGYVNASVMCHNANKGFENWLAILETQNFLKLLAAQEGLDVNKLIDNVGNAGGLGSILNGYWLHPIAAVELGRYLSTEWSVFTARLVDAWRRGAYTLPPSNIQKRRSLNYLKTPPGFFSIIEEIWKLLFEYLEDIGMSPPEGMRPDVSVGKHWNPWLRKEKGVEPNDFPRCLHEFDDGSPARMVRVYPDSLLAECRKWFYDIYLPIHAIPYYTRKQPEALPHIENIAEERRKMMRLFDNERNNKALEAPKEPEPKIVEQPKEETSIERPETHLGTCVKCDEYGLLLSEDNECLSKGKCDQSIEQAKLNKFARENRNADAPKYTPESFDPNKDYGLAVCANCDREFPIGEYTYNILATCDVGTPIYCRKL